MAMQAKTTPKHKGSAKELYTAATHGQRQVVGGQGQGAVGSQEMSQVALCVS
jgi:hypothetical protein